MASCLLYAFGGCALIRDKGWNHTIRWNHKRHSAVQGHYAKSILITVRHIGRSYLLGTLPHNQNTTLTDPKMTIHSAHPPSPWGIFHIIQTRTEPGISIGWMDNPLCEQARACLQARAVDDLHLNSELTAAIVEDEDTDAAAARLESLLETRPKVGLVNDRQTLLDIAGLGHGSDEAVSHVEDAVLLEDRAEHGLDNDAGSGVGNERGLLVQLLGEEVNTEVAVLASGRRGRDADDLAWSALEHQEVTQTDVVAGDGHSVRLRLGGRSWAARRVSIVADNIDLNVLCNGGVIIVTVMMVVVMVMGEQLVHCLGHAVLDILADGVVGAYRRHALAYACTRLADQRRKSNNRKKG